MNYKELIATLTPLYGHGEAKAIARLVFEEHFGLSQTDLLLGRDAALSIKERTDLEIIASELAKGRPVQHVLGYATFCGRPFQVNPDVLIPRPETEKIVELANEVDALHDCSAQGRPLHILDLGTGSGCIAISLALAMPDASVTAVDTSEAALRTARVNAQRLGTKNVDFVRHNMLAVESLVGHLTTKFDLIVSNPPYVRQSEAATMHSNVLLHEPHLALFVPDDDPLLFYRAIAEIAERCLAPTGTAIVEINSTLPHPTAAVFQDKGFTTKIISDLFDRPRFVRSHRES